jgi:dihydrofolate reductase
MICVALNHTRITLPLRVQAAPAIAGVFFSGPLAWTRVERILYYNSAMPPRARVSIVAALARNRAIGRNNGMPWRLPEDLKRFKRLTMGHAVIMGRKTFESIGSPLPGRDNIVITRSRDWSPAGCVVVDSLDAALAAVDRSREAFVIGGAQIYALALPLAQCLHMTEIARDFDGDVFFPEFDRAQWREISRERHAAAGAEGFDYAFVEYQRHPLAVR